MRDFKIQLTKKQELFLNRKLPYGYSIELYKVRPQSTSKYQFADSSQPINTKAPDSAQINHFQPESQTIAEHKEESAKGTIKQITKKVSQSSKNLHEADDLNPSRRAQSKNHHIFHKNKEETLSEQKPKNPNEEPLNFLKQGNQNIETNKELLAHEMAAQGKSPQKQQVQQVQVQVTKNESSEGKKPITSSSSQKSKPQEQQSQKKLSSFQIQCQKLLKRLKRQESAVYFRQPVDSNIQGVPDYYKVILEPIDLKTIEENLSKNLYQQFSQIERDIYRMIMNSYKFNKLNTEVFKKAIQFEDYYVDTIKAIKKRSGSIANFLRGQHQSQAQVQKQGQANEKMEEKIEARAHNEQKEDDKHIPENQKSEGTSSKIIHSAGEVRHKISKSRLNKYRDKLSDTDEYQPTQSYNSSKLNKKQDRTSNRQTMKKSDSIGPSIDEESMNNSRHRSKMNKKKAVSSKDPGNALFQRHRSHAENSMSAMDEQLMEPQDDGLFDSLICASKHSFNSDQAPVFNGEESKIKTRAKLSEGDLKANQLQQNLEVDRNQQNLSEMNIEEKATAKSLNPIPDSVINQMIPGKHQENSHRDRKESNYQKEHSQGLELGEGQEQQEDFEQDYEEEVNNQSLTQSHRQFQNQNNAVPKFRSSSRNDHSDSQRTSCQKISNSEVQKELSSLLKQLNAYPLAKQKRNKLLPPTVNTTTIISNQPHIFSWGNLFENNITATERKRIYQKISNLSDSDLSYVVEIIARNKKQLIPPFKGFEDIEFELDLDKVDNRTLRQISNFITLRQNEAYCRAMPDKDASCEPEDPKIYQVSSSGYEATNHDDKSLTSLSKKGILQGKKEIKRKKREYNKKKGGNFSSLGREESDLRDIESENQNDEDYDSYLGRGEDQGLYKTKEEMLRHNLSTARDRIRKYQKSIYRKDKDKKNKRARVIDSEDEEYQQPTKNFRNKREPEKYFPVKRSSRTISVPEAKPRMKMDQDVDNDDFFDDEENDDSRLDHQREHTQRRGGKGKGHSVEQECSQDLNEEESSYQPRPSIEERLSFGRRSQHCPPHSHHYQSGNPLALFSASGQKTDEDHHSLNEQSHLQQREVHSSPLRQQLPPPSSSFASDIFLEDQQMSMLNREPFQHYQNINDIDQYLMMDENDDENAAEHQ